MHLNKSPLWAFRICCACCRTVPQQMRVAKHCCEFTILGTLARDRKKNASGFTLLELMVVLAIVAILTTMAVPPFSRMLQSNTMSSTVNSFLADMRFSRSEAMRRGGGVVMCRSDAPEAPVPACGSGAGVSGNGWASGWIVYLDGNNDGVVSAGDLLRVQPPVTSMNSIMEAGSSSSTQFRFTPTGRLVDPSSATSLQFGGNAVFTSDMQRTVCVNAGGRARIAGDGTAQCGSNYQ